MIAKNLSVHIGSRFNIFWIGTFLIISLINMPAQAGSMSIWPLRLNLTPGQHIQKLHVKNDADEPAYMQATVSEWWTVENKKETIKIDDLIVVPPVFELPPGETQVIKLAYRMPDDISVERAYRLEVMEVPRTVGLLPNTAVIASRMVLPVFFSPEGSAPAPLWKLQQKPLENPELVMKNDGTAHINIKSVEVFDPRDEDLKFRSDNGDIVLPDEEKAWELEAKILDLQNSLLVKAETNVGPIEAIVSIP